jgi:cytochrome c oxidase subunit 2
MKQLGIAILIAAFIAVALPTVYHVANVVTPPTQRVGSVNLTPTPTPVGGAAATPPPAGPVDGATVAQASGCRACHTIDGSKLVGPSWKGLAGSTVSLTGGTTVTADDAYLHESIVDPAAKIVQGYTNDMPATFGKSLSAQQITALIDYIKTLK